MLGKKEGGRGERGGKRGRERETNEKLKICN
jgi:hypothetical protein